jgi:hypothetical protein
MTHNSQFIIAGLCAFIGLLIAIGTVKYIKELEKTANETTHEELD